MDKYSKIGLGVLLLIIFAVHTIKLAHVPDGLYVDETSIGYNAALIAEAGKDEHGESWPVFFEAFGEYKNPMYIYAAAAVFKVLGVSEFSLRFTSALFFMWFVGALGWLTQRMWRRYEVTAWVVAAAGFLPFFFPLSRIAFEVVSQLAIVTTWLVLMHMVYVRPAKKTLWLAGLAGATLAASIYAYSTSRLLAFLWILGWMVLFARKDKWREAVAGVVGFGVVLVPYVWFSLNNPGALTARFEILSYVYDANLNLWEKGVTFWQEYVKYYSIDYWLIQGDTNLRHATGFGGVMFASVVVLAVLGCVNLLKNNWRDDWARLILFLVVTAPMGAALTKDPAGHSLRSVCLGVGVLLLAGYGLQLLRLSANWKVIFVALWVALGGEVIAYTGNYFAEYPAKSVIWFETQGLKPALEEAVQVDAERVIVSKNMHQAKANVGFYSFVLPELREKEILVGEPVLTSGTCVVKTASEVGNFSPLIHGFCQD